MANTQMMNQIAQPYPVQWQSIRQATDALGFDMASEALVGSWLRSLVASRPKAQILELGTGTGLSTAWLLDGLTADSTLLSIDNDENVLAVAQQYLGHDARLTLRCQDGMEAITQCQATQMQFDLIFADTWAGKYEGLDETLALLKPHGLYVIDDMLPQPNWPVGHAVKVESLLDTLAQRNDLWVTPQAWSCGVVIATKIV